MEQKGLLEISSKSIKYISLINGKLNKKTQLLTSYPDDCSSIEEEYSVIKSEVTKIIRRNKSINFRTCILTGKYAKQPLADRMIESLKVDFSGIKVQALSSKEQLDYAYYSFIDEERKRSLTPATDDIDDIFVEISQQTVRVGLYRNGNNIDFEEINMGLKTLRDYFNDRCTGDASARYESVLDCFKKEFLEILEKIDLKPKSEYRVILSGGPAKSLAGGQDAGKSLQGKTYTYDELSHKAKEKLKVYSERFSDNPEAMWEKNHYTKMMNGVLSFIYVKTIMKRFSVESISLSGFGTIDSYYYRVAMGKTRHFRFSELLKALKAHQNVFLCGPAGSGKTTAAKQCSYKLKFKDDQQQRFYFTGAISNEYKLLGYMDANGRYVSTEFRKAYENGGVFLFDEVDASFPQPLLAFNAALSGDQMDFPDGTVKKHKDFYCIATANTYGSGASRQYVGRNQLDAAFLDRFVFIDWPYDEELERNMTNNEEWAEHVQRVRHAIDKLGFGKMGVRHIVSPRATENGAALLEIGIDRRRVEEMVIWKGLERETVQMIKNNMD